MAIDIVLIDEKTIRDKMYNIRGQYVMIDSDLAEIYGYETRYFNRQVNNNIEKFESDFMFQLTENEYKNLMCKNFTSSWGENRKLPYVFTEQGIYMLMTVLKGEKATEQSKALIRIFKGMKDYLINNNLKVIKNNSFHDRFIILDKNIIYHIGSSINHLGNKIFGINLIEEVEVKKSLLNKINKILN